MTSSSGASRRARPNQLWVADLTCVASWQGLIWVALITDVYSRMIVGWRVTKAPNSSAALDALEQALHARDAGTGLVHHSDRGVQYLSIKYTERLAEAGIETSVGSVGNSYDNALAESVNGLYKAELIRRRGPWRGLEGVELATLEWVDWYNKRRLHSAIGNMPPEEFEGSLSSGARDSGDGRLTQTIRSPENPGRFRRHSDARRGQPGSPTAHRSPSRGDPVSRRRRAPRCAMAGMPLCPFDALAMVNQGTRRRSSRDHQGRPHHLYESRASAGILHPADSSRESGVVSLGLICPLPRPARRLTRVSGGGTGPPVGSPMEKQNG